MTECVVELKRANSDEITYLSIDGEGRLTEDVNQVNAKVFANHSVGFKHWAEYARRLEQRSEDIPYIVHFLPAHLLHKHSKALKEKRYA